MPELEGRDREGGRVQLENIRQIYRSRGVDGMEAETDNFVRDAIFDWQPVELTERIGVMLGEEGARITSRAALFWTL